MDTFSNDILAALIRQYRPEVGGAIFFSPIPTGKFNTSYLVHLDGDEWVLRIAPPPDAVFVFYEREMMKQEPQIHPLVQQKTTVPIANILAFDESHNLIDRDWMLMERLPGKPLSESFLVDESRVLRQVGSCLAQVHALTATQYGYLGAHAPMPPQPTWNEAFQVMWRKLVEDVAAVGYYTDEESLWLIKRLDQFLPLFDRTVPASLLHGDIWGQNILIDSQGHLTGLLDWDRALWGDPELEFAILDYCGISQPAFWEGYGQQRDHSQAAQIRRIFYLLYEIQKYIVIRHGRHHDQVAAQKYKQQVVQMVRQYLGR